MSTRCNIVIQDSTSKIFLYRHMDGYPSHIVPILRKVLKQVQDHKLNAAPGQVALQVLHLGLLEYTRFLRKMRKYAGGSLDFYKQTKGFIEPTDGLHGDVAYVYSLDIGREEILFHKYDWQAECYGPLIVDDGKRKLED